MFEKLQSKWKVSGWNLFLVLVTFALGGSLCGYLGRKLLLLTGLEGGVLWFILYIIVVTLLWPLCVLLVSVPLGQFRFFRNYISRIIGKMKGSKPAPIAIFASGTGSNADKIIQHFSGHKLGVISLVVSDKADAGVLEIARRNNINTLIINKKQLDAGTDLLSELSKRKIQWIVLAGFLQKIPPALVKAYPNRILNIHPALLPKYGGKGMYGMHVHRAVLANQERESGITIHLVDDHYDHGETIFQATCPVAESDSPETLAKKVQALEHTHFPRVIEEILQNPR